MTQKKLQKSSIYEEYDEDGDGVVSDEELAHVAEIKKLENNLRKQRAQRRMATASLIAMGAFTVAMFLLILRELKHWQIFLTCFISLVLVLLVHTWVPLHL